MILTNDTTTLDGALQELGELMATNLQTKGVNASASDGLTTLAGKILDITGGGGSGVPCYNVNFTENSWNYSDYNFTNNSHYVHLELYLQYQYEPYANGTITVTDGTNTYTITSNANGLATLDAPISASTTTFTATYTNTTDTIAVKKSTFILIDKCDSSSGLTNYSSSVPTYKSTNGNPSCTLSYDSSRYKLVAANTSTTYYSMIPVTATAGKTDYIVDVEIWQNASQTNAEAGLFVINTQAGSSDYGIGSTINVYNNKLYMRRQSLSSTSTSVSQTISGGTIAKQTWYHMRMIVNSSVVRVQLYTTGGTLLEEVSYTITIPNKQLGLYLRGGNTTNSVHYYRNLKIRDTSTS